MCRFLLAHSTEALDPSALLAAFARMCQVSRSRDDAWQGDGWGVAWRAPDGRAPDGCWKLHKSLRPIWEDGAVLPSIPGARAFAVHARSASFEKDRNNLEFNQPYLSETSAFVFNGLLRGVSMPTRVEGGIGAQRIWNMLRTEMGARTPADALAQVVGELEARTRHLVACNIGLIDAQHIYAMCRFAGNPDYYQLRWHASDRLRMVCSEPLPGFDFQPVPVDHVLVL
jgi:predicted glutamine amidotransferase